MPILPPDPRKAPRPRQGPPGRRAGRLLLASCCLSALAGAAPAYAQDLSPAGYYLHVASASASGPLSPSGVSDFQRLRLMLSPSFASVRLDLAYEHSLDLVSDPELGFVPSLGEIEIGTDWLPFQGTIAEGDHARWRHRLDRLSVAVPLGGDVELTVGRQALSWATTLLLTPADPFAPFDPTDPFREYRAGVDAARLRVYAGAFTDVDLVVRLADTRDGTRATALGRLHAAPGRWELAGWAGLLYAKAAASGSATLTAAGTAFRGEVVVREADPGGGTVRLAVGVDRSFRLAGRDLYVTAEYQHDGLGASSAEEIPAVVRSAAFSRGELQVLGRDETALRVSFQAHPLLSAEVAGLWNPLDGSALVVPAASYSVSDEVSARAGLFLGFGAGEAEGGVPASEYGPVPATLYVALTAFF